MNRVGMKIRELRKKKGITQEKLAEVLSISFQTVSKWENGLTAPDINLLPIIADYFGITIDELFGHRPDTFTYKERFIKFMVDNGVLRFGEFDLSSSRKSPYYMNVAGYKDGSQLSRLGEFYADVIHDYRLQANLLFGMGNNATLLAAISSTTLFYKYGINMSSCFHHIDEPQKSQQGYITGKQIEDGDEIIILDDTITSGKTLRHTYQELTGSRRVVVKAVIVALDRMEKGIGDQLSAVREIKEELGIPVYSIVTVQDIMSAIEHEVIAGKEYLMEIRKYYYRYGGRDYVN